MTDTQLVVYVNPHNNADYVVCENNEQFFVLPDEDFKHVYDYNHGIEHRPVHSRKRSRPQLIESEDKMRVLFKKKRTDPHKKTWNNHMTKIGFVSYFLKSPESPSVDLLGSIYDVLEGFEFNQQTLDVVSAAIQFVYTKSLVNTMARNCERKNKKFKRQLQYVLSRIVKSAYT